jgi:hypothetical protein
MPASRYWTSQSLELLEMHFFVIYPDQGFSYSSRRWTDIWTLVRSEMAGEEVFTMGEEQEEMWRWKQRRSRAVCSVGHGSSILSHN